MIVEVLRRDHVQRLGYDDFERRVREGELGPEVQVRLDVVTGDAFRPLGELELYRPLADPEPQAFRRAVEARGLPLATAILVGLQVQLWLLSKLGHVAMWYREHLLVWTPGILERGEVWRLLTYGFLHLDFNHILFNMLFLAYAGYHLERVLGWRNLLTLYLGTVLVGGLFSMAGGADRFSLGASGGGFGLLGAAVVFGVKHRDAIPIRERRYFGFAIAPYPVVSLLMSLSNEGVDNWCHVGGLLSGLLLGAVLEPPMFAARERRNRVLRAVAAAAGLGVLALLTVRGPAMVPLERWVPDRAEGTGYEAWRPAWWERRTVMTQDLAFGLPTRDVEMVALVDTRAQPRPLDEALDELLARISGSAAGFEERSREAVERDGAPGWRVVASTLVRGVPRELVVELYGRGVYEYATWVSVPQADLPRYEPLRARLLGAVRLAEPEPLRLARAKTELYPELWASWVDLGAALSATGDPQGAIRAYNEALARAPEEGRALAGLLQVYTDWQLSTGEAMARQALEVAPLSPEVVVAAAAALEAAGKPQDAVAALNTAWEALPGDRVLRRARERRGLSLDWTLSPRRD